MHAEIMELMGYVAMTAYVILTLPFIFEKEKEG